MTGQAHLTRWLDQVSVVGRTVDVMAAEAGHAALVHLTLDEVVPLHPVLVTRAVGEVRERLLAQLVLLQAPEVLELPALMESNRPVVVLAIDRIRQRLALRMPLNAGIVRPH